MSETDLFAQPDDAAGIAERAKLQRKAEPIVAAPPSSDVPQLFWRQGVVADDLSLAFGQGEHGGSSVCRSGGK